MSKQSLYRHTTGDCSTMYDNWQAGSLLQPLSLASSDLKCNDRLVAAPASNAGKLMISHIINNTADSDLSGQKSSLIEVHRENLTDFEFYPFNSTLLATSSTDSLIKFWQLEADDNITGRETTSIKANDKSPASTLVFHPLVSNLLVSTHQSKSVYMWDIENQSQVFAIDGVNPHGDTIDNVSVSGDGSLLVTSCRDKQLRFFDPRSSARAVFTVKTHDSNKGFQAIWMGSQPHVVTCGFNNSSSREMLQFDYRNLKSKQTAMRSTIIDRESSPLCPYYVPENQILFISGKSDKVIRYYDMSQQGSEFTMLNEYCSDETHRALSQLPRSAVDVTKCEIASLLRLTTQNSLQSVSFTVPRRNLELYQEDIYSDDTCPEPCLNVTEWINSKQPLQPKMADRKPENMKSIYEVPVEEGGKPRPGTVQESDSEDEDWCIDGESDSSDDEDWCIETEADKVEPSNGSHINDPTGRVAPGPPSRVRARSKAVVTTSGRGTEQEVKPKPKDATEASNSIQRMTRKFSEATTSMQHMTQEFTQAINFSGFLEKKNPSGIGKKKRWFTIDDGNIFYFEKKESSKSLGKIGLSEVKDVVPGKKATFVIKTNGRDYNLIAPDQTSCDSWVSNIRLAMNPFSQFEARQKKAERAEAVQSTGFNLCGKLKKLGVTGGWRKRYFYYSPEDHILSYRAKKGKSALGNIHLDKVLHIEKGVSTKISKKSGHRCLQVFTPGRNFILKAPDDEMCNTWYQTLVIEVEFIKKLLEDEHRGGQQESDVNEDLDNQVRGQLLTILPDGTLKKRWIVFDDDTASLYLFNSRTGDEQLISGQPVDKIHIDQILRVHEMASVEELSPDLASTLSLKRDDANYYFVVKTIHGGKIIFLCPTVNVKRSWIDSLQILKEFYENSDESPEYTQDESQDADMRLGVTNAIRKPKKPVAVTLGITDIREKPSKDLPTNDQKSIKEGKEFVLYLVKGKRNVNVTQVELSLSSLNRNNVYVVDCGPIIYQWNGKHSHKLEKAKGLELATTLKFKERGGAAEIKLIDDGSDMDDEMRKYNEQFWRMFGGIQNADKIASDDVDDDLFEKSMYQATSLYRVSNNKDLGKAVTTVGLPSKGKPSRDILNTKNVYVLDTKDELMVWVGKGAVPLQKNLAMVVAEKLMAQPNRQPWVKVTQTMEGSEIPLWKEKFYGYPGMLPISMNIVEMRGNIAAKKDEEEIDVNALLKNSIRNQKEEFAYSENTAFKSRKLRIWRINKFKKEDYPDSMYGHFYSQDTFIILFTWTEKNNTTSQHILFFWQGRDTSSQSKGASALLSVGIDDSLDGSATQVRIEQNKEPDYFLMLFKNRFIVHKGSYSARSGGSRLYDVRGTTANNVKAVEIESDFTRLNPLHCFVLIDMNGNGFIWKGSRSNTIEYEHAKTVASILSRNNTEVKEGGEPESFISSFATRGKSYIKPASKPSRRHEARLFMCSVSTGIFSCEEVRYVTQDELQHNCCYVLVPYADQGSIFVWLGKSSDDQIKKGALQTARQMLALLGAEGFSKAFVVYDGKERPEFYYSIQGWNTTSAAEKQRRSSIMPSAQAKKESSPTEAPLASLVDVMKIYCGGVTYSYQDLLREPLPDGVDALKLESYLSEQDFAAVFDISKQEFYTYPIWKQQSLKKKVYLF